MKDKDMEKKIEIAKKSGAFKGLYESVFKEEYEKEVKNDIKKRKHQKG